MVTEYPSRREDPISTQEEIALSDPFAIRTPNQEPGINPFAGNQSVEQQPSRLNFGGNVLSTFGSIEGFKADTKETKGLEDVARAACGIIANMYVTDGDPDTLTFPRCDDTSVISESLHRFEATALGLGYGTFPNKVFQAWTRFTAETLDNYRSSHNLEPAELVPLRIDVPAWLEGNPDFDILPNCRLVDIEINGAVSSTIATGAQFCRISFNDSVTEKARVGTNARRCTFLFKSNMYADRSFESAQNMLIRIQGNQHGNLGAMSYSRVECQGTFSGSFAYKNYTNCTSTPNVRTNGIG